MLVWNGLGLAGEAGELSELIKKFVFHQHGFNKDAFKKELGDVLWYLTAICSKLDISLSEVMQENLNKSQERYPDGFTSTDSINRKK
jgi:NTP pyrophosphatase (non-canonical NTP hydrolase)